MRESGNWILPQLDGSVYAEKPPLFFWWVNLSTFVLGKDSEFGNRLPSALAGLACLLITFLLGEGIVSLRDFHFILAFDDYSIVRFIVSLK